MSGGYFDYAQYSIEDQVDAVDKLIAECDYSTATRNAFIECRETLKRAAIYLHRIDWLVSGDDSEDTFHDRLITDLIGAWSKR